MNNKILKSIKESIMARWIYIIIMLLANSLFLFAIYKSCAVKFPVYYFFIALTTLTIIIPNLFNEAMFHKFGIMLIAALYSYMYIEAYTVGSMVNGYEMTKFLNILAYFMIITFMYALTKKMLACVCVFQAFWVLTGYVSFLLKKIRGNALFISDLASIRTAMNVAGEYSLVFTSWIVIEAIIMILVPVIMCISLKRNEVVRIKFKPKYQIAILLVTAIASVNLYNQAFLKDNGITFTWWTHERYNGFLVGTIVQAENYGTQKPVNYSPETVERIKEENTLKTQTNQDKPDIICVMNESFSDLRVINNFSKNEEYMPYFNTLKLDPNTITGNLYVSVKGGNTANTEYEFLSGDTMGFYNSMIPFNAYVNREMPNNVTAMEKQGYTTLGFHPWNKSGWSREKVYKLLGFDKSYFISDLDSNKIERMRNYPSDSYDYSQLNTYYDQMPESPRFLFNVTMQNHGGYTSSDFDSFIKVDGEDKYKKTNQYLTLIKHSDDALKELIEHYKKVDRKVIICFWGDHQPAVEDEFFEKLYGKKLDSLTQEELEKQYITPFLIWANYDIPHEYIDKMSANYLFPYLAKTAGLELTPYQNYLLKLREKYPVISGVGAIDANGKYYKPDEMNELEDIQEYYTVIKNRIFDYKNMVSDFFD